MIVYCETKQDFMEHVRNNVITDMVESKMRTRLGRRVSSSEVNSWRNSLQFMRNILDDADIPPDSGVAIEYNIPQTSKRIDFILSGYNSHRDANAVIIELKQWDVASLTKKDAIVRIARFGEVLHPSYQATSYKQFLEDYNEAIRDGGLILSPCAYLHNYKNDDVIRNVFYREYLEQAPVFLMEDSEKLRAFIKQFIKYGDGKNILYQIDDGRIKPSKNLADSLSSLIKGNKEFVLLDNQKLVFETALDMADNAEEQKNVLIVKGGPGTGKSVVAINLLVEIIKREKLAQYVTSNSAPRVVYEASLTGTMNHTRYSNLFKGATVYQKCDSGDFDALIVDEAHRLSARNIMNTYQGNQIRDIINAAKFSVFFIDESQKVLLEDIGSEEEICSQAKALGAKVTTMELPSQFRCNGSDGYLAWIDNTLGIRETANRTLEGIDYDFRVMNSPAELHNLIRQKNLINNKSRVVAGYCWPWVSKNNQSAKDIVIGEYEAQWNKSDDGMHWAIKEGTVEEIGCIHTCQGLEFEYIGVIIGEDLISRSGKVLGNPDARASVDANKTLRGYKTLMKNSDPSVVKDAKKRADEIIKNTYKVLMTRGQRGCFVYCCDPELGAHFKKCSYTNLYKFGLEHEDDLLRVAETTIAVPAEVEDTTG